MELDLTKLNTGLISSFEFSDKLEIPLSMIEKTDIVSLTPLEVNGRVTKTSAETYNLNARVTGTMILKCALSLEDVEYPLDIVIDENISDDENEENLKINTNLLEILPIIWENIVLEIPLRVVKQNYTAKTQGEGWSILNQEESIKENGLSELNKLLDVEEER